jgi:hypothetical protein
MTYTFVNVKILSAGLKVTESDATSDHLPTNNSPSTPDEEGKQFYYRPIRRRETKWDLYCTKLGAALARELKKANKNIVIPHGEFNCNCNNVQFFSNVIILNYLSYLTF